MELVSAYLYSRVPVETANISNLTFHQLKRNGWYSDVRSNKKYNLLNKRIEANNTWYRVLMRFEYNGLSTQGQEMFQLSAPCPFLITECVPMEGITARWKDLATYHGPKLENITGYLRAGVPSVVIDQVYADLKKHIQYNN